MAFLSHCRSRRQSREQHDHEDPKLFGVHGAILNNRPDGAVNLNTTCFFGAATQASICFRQQTFSKTRDKRMSRTAFRALATTLALFTAAAPLLSHHEPLAKFDPAKTRTLKGIVTRLDWSNPHVHILMNVAEGNRV